MNAPIVIFVYNRADHFRTVYEALKKCPEAKDSELFIFADGAKSEAEQIKVQQVRTFLKSIQDDTDFKSLTIRESLVNKGLAQSIISGVTEVIQKYGKIIVLEDDCVPSEYFLHYMNDALDYYENDKGIGSIAGYAEKMALPENYTSDIYLAWRSCSNGWATWSDRWENIDWTLKNSDKLFRSIKLLSEFNENGSDRITRLCRQKKGKANSWSVCFGLHHILKGMYVVYPRYSYIYNIGNDGTGVHTKAGDIDEQYDLSNAIPNPDVTKPNFNKSIQKMIKKSHSAGLISDVKRFLFTVFVWIRANL